MDENTRTHHLRLEARSWLSFKYFQVESFFLKHTANYIDIRSLKNPGKRQIYLV